MTIETHIVGSTGPKGNKRETHVHPFETASGTHVGFVTLNHRFIKTEPATKFFLNDTVGNALNQDVSFGTTGNILHDGGSSASVDTGNANVNTEFFLEDSGGVWGTGGDAELVQVGMTVEETGASAYARISTVTGTKLGLTTIASKGAISSDIFPLGSEAYIINAVWTGTATVGTWDFSTSNVITQAAGNNNDQADIEAVAADQSFTDDFTALTGNINLNTYAEANHDIRIQLLLSGVPIGVSVLLNQFIDTGDFSAQQFSIPLEDLEVGNLLTNGVRITIIRNGGAKPAFTLDNIRLEVKGTPLVFEVLVDRGERFHISELVFAYADALVSEKTGLSGDTEAFTNDFLSYDAILGVSALTNGFVIARSKGGKTLFSATIKTLGDQISAGAIIGELFTDNANTFITLRIIFPDPLILTGNSDDILTITINDDMSGLLQFTAVARGSVEV